MGKKIVLTSFGSYGDVNPYVALALELKRRGHQPVVATSEYYRPVVEREGIEFHPVRPDVDPGDAETIRRIMDPREGTSVILREIIFPALRKSYADLSDAVHGADLLVSHPVTFAGPIIGEKTGLPWVSTVLAPMSFFSPRDLPVFAPFPAAKRLQKVPGAARLMVRMAKRTTKRWSRPVRHLRTELGLPPGKNPIFEGQFSPRLTLALFSRVLAQPQRDWPANVRVTGPLLYDRPGAGEELPSELEAFLESGPAPVVFTLGTSAVAAAGTARRFWDESLRAAGTAGVRAVLLVGRNPAHHPPGPLPVSAIAVEYARHSLLFPRAAAAVHQGGAGTLAQALRSGRPMLVVPHAHDQPDNAFRAARLGVARTLHPKRYRAKRVAAELRALLGNPWYAERAAAVGAETREEDGVRAAADALEEVLAEG